MILLVGIVVTWEYWRPKGDKLYFDMRAALIIFAIAFVCLTGIVTWLVLRISGLFAALLCLWRKWLVDLRLLERVIAYESVVLWVFCIWWALLAISFSVWGQWVTELLGSTFFYSITSRSPEAVIVFLSTAGMILAWVLIRFPSAIRHVRWANN